MNKRTIAILRELDRLEQPVSMEELAEKFQISTRTVRNDLKQINDILTEHQLETLTLQKGGIILCGSDFPQVFACIDENDFYDYKLSREERKKIAAVLLISAEKYITLSQIADYMAVSRATIIHDLDEIKQYLKDGKLLVQSHPNKGLSVEGTESAKRKFLLKLIQGHPAVAEESIVQKQLATETDTRSVLQKILSEQERHHGHILSDASFQKMSAYLEILINRIRKNAYVEPQNPEQNYVYEMADDILHYMEQYCHMKSTPDETLFLAALLGAERCRKQKNTSQDSVMIQMKTRDFIEAVSKELSVDLNTDFDFFENLSNHIENTVTAETTDTEKNPVIETIVDENTAVRDVVQNNILILEEGMKRRLSGTEIGYLTVHVCAALERKKNREAVFRIIIACHAGIGTSYLLQERLKKHFHFQIVDIISAHEAKNLLQEQADLVISTVPLKECSIANVVVPPVLHDEDYLRIGKMLDMLQERTTKSRKADRKKQGTEEILEQIADVLYEQVPDQALELTSRIGRILQESVSKRTVSEEERYAPALYQLLPASHITLEAECGTWQEAVRCSAQNLLDFGIIEKYYIDAMIQNVEENGPYIVISKGFAFPHEGIDKGCRKLGMSLIRLKTPVNFDAEERDPVEFVCCLSAIDHNTHLKAFFHLIQMLKNETFKQELHDCGSPEEAAEIIRKYEKMTELE